MSNETSIQKVAAGTIAKNEFGAQSIEATGETVASVLAARAKAEVEARYIVAMKRPRDWLDVRARMLAACERPGFAGLDKRKGEFGQAWWSKPVGNSSIEGFSIRFAEEALRNMGNMDARTQILWEDDNKRIIEVTVMDLEANLSIPTTIVIEKTIERKFLKKGEVAISSRTNSYGETVYLRKSTEDETTQMQNSQVSKAMRNAILRLLPGDIQAECRNRILQIRYGDVIKDPKQFQKKIADGFAKHGITPSELTKYLGHELSSSSQSELAMMRDLWKEIDAGKATWHEIVSAKAVEEGEEPPNENPPIKDLTEKLKQKNRSTQKAKPETKKQDKTEVKNQENIDPESGEVLPEVEPAAFDPIVELQLIAKDMWGKKADEALSVQCGKHDVNFEKITTEQASMMIDVLNNLSEEYKSKKNK